MNNLEKREIYQILLHLDIFILENLYDSGFYSENPELYHLLNILDDIINDESFWTEYFIINIFSAKNKEFEENKSKDKFLKYLCDATSKISLYAFRQNKRTLVQYIYYEYFHISANEAATAAQATAAQVITIVKNIFSKICIETHIGGRSYNEDRHIKTDFKIGHTLVALLSVLDGHGGDKVADIASKEIPNKLRFLLEENANNLFNEKVMKAILTQFVINYDKELFARHETGEIDTSGSTFSMLIAIKGESGLGASSEKKIAYVINLGDSRILGYNAKTGKIFFETKDHTSKCTDEKRRITSIGGSLAGGRVGGILIPSRVLGDFHVGTKCSVGNSNPALSSSLLPRQQSVLQRPLSISPTLLLPNNIQNQVQGKLYLAEKSPASPIPDVFSIHLDDENSEFIIATDGLWDYYQSRELAPLMIGMILPHPYYTMKPYSCKAEYLIDKVVTQLGKSADNVTVIYAVLE